MDEKRHTHPSHQKKTGGRAFLEAMDKTIRLFMKLFVACIIAAALEDTWGVCCYTVQMPAPADYFLYRPHTQARWLSPIEKIGKRYALHGVDANKKHKGRIYTGL